jgi:thioesterase domain-containing protein
MPPDLSPFRSSLGDLTGLEAIRYPGWKRYVAPDFSIGVFIDELVAEILAKVPQGPIRIIGSSIGGHFGYAVALKLQAQGHELAGFCAIDTFMIASSAPSAGWKGRAAGEAWALISQFRMLDFFRLIRSKFWRAALRSARDRLPEFARVFQASGRVLSAALMDPVFEDELSMRLLIREAAPWIAALDRDPTPLNAPSILIRTQSTAGDDGAWRRRCPDLDIYEIDGKHHSLWDPENVGSLRDAFASATRNWC